MSLKKGSFALEVARNAIIARKKYKENLWIMKLQKQRFYRLRRCV